MGLLRPVWSSRVPRTASARPRWDSSASSACTRGGRTADSGGRRPSSAAAARAHRDRHVDPDRGLNVLLFLSGDWSASDRASPPTGGLLRCTRHIALGRAMQGIAGRPVVPADQRRRSCHPQPWQDRRPGASSTSRSTCGRCSWSGLDPGAAVARPGPLPHGLPAQRARRRRRRVLPDRPVEQRARARRQRGAIFGLFGAWPVVASRRTEDRHPGDPGADRDQPGVQLHLPRRDRLAGSHRRARSCGAPITAAFAYAPRKNRAAHPGRAPRSPSLACPGW